VCVCVFAQQQNARLMCVW